VQVRAIGEEWIVIQPHLVRVVQLRSIMAQGGDGTARPDLERILRSPIVSEDAVAGQVKSIREAGARNRAELKAAQVDLRDLLTTRQEALLLSLGYLE
jgi:hypothetical protein